MKTYPVVVAIVMAVVMSAACGCDNDEGMGTNILPAADMADIVIDTIEVKAYTELEGAVASTNMSYMLVGAINDPIFGVTEASFACKFSNSSYGKYSKDDVCDSILLTIGIDTLSTYIYGDTLKPVTVDVYPLIQPIYADSTYYSNFDMTGMYDENKLVATGTFVPSELDSMMTFKVDKSYGDEIISHSLDTTFDKHICGFYFKVSDSNTGNSITKFNRSNSHTQYILYHHVPEKDTASSSVVYSIQSTDCTFNLSKHDYTGTDLSDVTSNASGEQSDYLYLQALTGTRVRIDLTGLDKVKRGKYFSLRNALLIAPLADSAYSLQADYPAIDNYVCCGLNKSTGKDEYFDEYLINVGGSPSLYVLMRDKVRNRYTLNMTGRINDYFDKADKGEEVDYNIYLYPNGRTTDFNRSVICSPVNKKTPMKLIVEYINMNL